MLQVSSKLESVLQQQAHERAQQQEQLQDLVQQLADTQAQVAQLQQVGLEAHVYRTGAGVHKVHMLLLVHSCAAEDTVIHNACSASPCNMTVQKPCCCIAAADCSKSLLTCCRVCPQELEATRAACAEGDLLLQEAEARVAAAQTAAVSAQEQAVQVRASRGLTALLPHCNMQLNHCQGVHETSNHL